MEPTGVGIPLLDFRAWLGALGVLASAYLLGAILRLRLRGRTGPVSIGERLLLGLALLPIGVLAAGQVPGWLRGFPWAALAIGGLLWMTVSVTGAWRALGEALAARRTPERRSSTAATRIPSAGRVLGWAGGATLAATWLILLGPSLSPPLNYDVLEYHVAVVPHYFERGRIEPIPGVFYSAQPLATEMLYTLAALIEGAARGWAPGLVQWLLIGLAACALIGLLARIKVNSSLRPWIVLLFIAHPVIFKSEIDRMTDLTGALFLMGGLGCALNAWEGRTTSGLDARAVFEVGLLAGAAVTSKWTNAGTTAPILFGALAVLTIGPGETVPEARSGSSSMVKRLARTAGLFILGGLIVLLPWNLWLANRAGNPFAPFLARFFPTDAWDAPRLEFLIQTHRPLSPLAVEFWANLRGRLGSLAGGPPLLSLALVVVLLGMLLDRMGRKPDAMTEEYKAEVTAGDGASPGKRLAVGLLGGMAVAVLLWGRLAQAADRFLAPVIAAQCVVLAVAVQSAVAGRSRRAAELAAIVLALMAIPYWGPQLAFIKEFGYWSHATGRLPSELYLRRGLGETARLFEAANALPEASSLLAIGEARGFYLRRATRLATVFDLHPIRMHLAGAAGVEELRNRLRGAGFSHLLVNEPEVARLLRFHPPPPLLNDPEFIALRRQGTAADAMLAERYSGWVEFGPTSIPDAERAIYKAFLEDRRSEAIYLSRPPSGPHPALWIAPI